MEWITLIEDAPLRLEDRVEWLLVCLGEKPATDVKLYDLHNCSPEGEFILSQETEQRLKEQFSRLFAATPAYYAFGTKARSNCILKMNINGEDYFPWVEVLPGYVGRDAESLALLKNAKDDSGRGRAYGYPDTAIDAFLGNRPRSNHPSPFKILSGFVFSEDHYEEELETSRRWHDALKKASLRLYGELYQK